jgi:hypothetical protein
MRMCLQEFHEPGEYGVMTAAAVSQLQAVAFGEDISTGCE